MRTILSGALGVALLLSNAQAQSFTGPDIEGFIAVIEGADALSDKYDGQFDDEAAVLQRQMSTDFTDLGALLDEDGDFRIFRLTTDAMREAGDIGPVRDYRQLVKDAGFADLSAFGIKADAMMMAWMAMQMDPGEMGDLADMPPEMMAMMPAGVRKQMAGVMRLQKALQSVPAEDLDAMRPYKARMEAAFE